MLPLLRNAAQQRRQLGAIKLRVLVNVGMGFGYRSFLSRCPILRFGLLERFVRAGFLEDSTPLIQSHGGEGGILPNAAYGMGIVGTRWFVTASCRHTRIYFKPFRTCINISRFEMRNSSKCLESGSKRGSKAHS